MGHAGGDEHRAIWEERYASKPQVWSGRVNTRLAAVVEQLSGNRALDLGCGEGADAIWLAERGWTVVAVDISDTALNRARAAAAAQGVAGRIDFRQCDLTRGLPAFDAGPRGGFDLVSAQFLHSTVAMDRAAILRAAAAEVAAGGTLLIVDHGAAPPWAPAMRDHEFPPAESVVAGLALDPRDWEPIQLGSVERAARGPEGEEVTLVDNVIRLRRCGAGD